MIVVLYVDVKAKQVYQERIPPSYFDFEKLIGTPFWVVPKVDGGDSIFCCEHDASQEADFELDHCRFTGPAIIFRDGEYGIPGDPRMSLAEARERIRFLKMPGLHHLLPET